MIIFSDLHLQESTEDVVFGEVLPGIEAAAEANDGHIAFLGDWWHIRYNVSVRLFNRVLDTLRRWSAKDFAVDLLPGNHDQVDIEGRNALEAMGQIPRVMVYTEPTWTPTGLWVPYRKFNDDVRRAIATPCPPGWDEPVAGRHPQRILWIHHGVQGALMNECRANTEGLPVAEFGKFQHVFCGHYHKRQQLSHVTYIGSPYQVSANEAGQDKGYAIYDEAGFRFVNMNWGRRIFTVEWDGSGKFQLPDGVTERDEVRVKTLGPDAQKNAEKAGKLLAKAGVASVVTPEVQTMQARLQVANTNSLAEYVQAYVDQVPTELDRARLMQAFKYIVE